MNDPRMDSVVDRYRTDADFHQLVKMLESLLHQGIATYQDLHSAATYAALRFELHTSRPVFIYEQKEES